MVAIKMLLAVFRLFVCLCVVTANTANRYHEGRASAKSADGQVSISKKTDFISARWKDRHGHRGLPTETAAGDYYHHFGSTPIGHYYGGAGVRVRHSRHPNLDKVLTKIDGLKVAANAVRPNPVPRVHWRTSTARTPTTTSGDDLFDDYADADDLNYDDDWDAVDDNTDGGDVDDDVIDNYDDGEDNFDEEFDDDDADNDDGSWQAEEATEKPQTQSKLTELKWQHYGTRDKVEESRRNHLNLRNNNNHEAVQAVVQHALRVDEEGRCRRPTPRVISVQTVYPDPSKTYIPHCTVLYRCAEDTGCCSNYATKCAPKKQTKVQLYFYTNTMGSARNNKVEKLDFYNHTECACLETSQISSSTALMTDDETSYPEVNGRTGLRVRAAPDSEFVQPPERIRRCKCPEMYTAMLKYNNRCACDCTDGKQDCVRMKKGREYFSLTDRKCIFNNECGLPRCEYGPYLRHKGRCPKKEEKLEAFSKMNVN